MSNIRESGGRKEMDLLWAAVFSLKLLTCFSTRDAPAIGNGTTNGNLRTTASAGFSIGDRSYVKASTDDLWDLSGETAVAAAKYRAYWLLLDSAGAATIAGGVDQASEALALADLPTLDGTKSVMGVFVAGPATDFTAALAAQGDIYDGLVDGVPVGVRTQTYRAPDIDQLAAF